MQYTAKSVTAATDRWPLVIGKETYWARPLSAALILRLVPMMTQPETGAVAVLAALRAAFPRGPWWRRDPLRRVLRLSPEVQGRILAEALKVPGQVPLAEIDPEAALIAAHRRRAGADTTTPGPTLAIAVLACQVRLGAGWYYAPQMWPTVDGYAPVGAVWTTYAGLAAIDAHARLQHAQAVQLANATGPRVMNEWEKLQRLAFPRDPSMGGRN